MLFDYFKVSLCSLDWPQSRNPPASGVLDSQVP